MGHLEAENVRFQLRQNLNDPVKAVFASSSVAVVHVVSAETEFCHRVEKFKRTFLYHKQQQLPERYFMTVSVQYQ